MIGTVLDDIRLGLETLRLLDARGGLDRVNLLAAIGLLDDRIDEIEVLVGVGAVAGGAGAPATVRLPVLTLADVAREARADAAYTRERRRAALTVHEGGLA